MVVINWMNKIQNWKITNLGPIFEEVCKLMEKFETITCRHVYREIYSKEDKVSKEGLRMEQGTWNLTE